MKDKSFPSNQDLEDIRLALSKTTEKEIKIGKIRVHRDLLLAVMADVRLSRQEEPQHLKVVTADEAIQTLTAERNAQREANNELIDRLSAMSKELGQLSVKMQIQQDALTGLRAASKENFDLYSGACKQLEDLKKKYLAFICAECGAPTSTDCDGIDNGTSLTCDQCGKVSVVSLRRLGEQEGEELVRVAEWAMAAKNILRDHNNLLDVDLNDERRFGETLRDVVTRMKKHLDFFKNGTFLCTGNEERPHKFVLVSAVDGCPVCAVTKLIK